MLQNFFLICFLLFICLKTPTNKSWKGDPSSYFCFAAGCIMCSLNETKFKQNFSTWGLGKLQEFFDRKKWLSKIPFMCFYHCQFVKPAINRLIPCSHDIKWSRRMRRPDCVRDISWCKHNMCFFGYHCYPLSSNDKLHSLGAIWLLLHDWSLSNYTGMMAMSKY